MTLSSRTDVYHNSKQQTAIPSVRSLKIYPQKKIYHSFLTTTWTTIQDFFSIYLNDEACSLCRKKKSVSCRRKFERGAHLKESLTAKARGNLQDLLWDENEKSWALGTASEFVQSNDIFARVPIFMWYFNSVSNFPSKKSWSIYQIESKVISRLNEEDQSSIWFEGVMSCHLLLHVLCSTYLSGWSCSSKRSLCFDCTMHKRKSWISHIDRHCKWA